MKKRLIMVVAVLCMCCTLSYCGEKDNADSKRKVSSVAEAVKSSAEPSDGDLAVGTSVAEANTDGEVSQTPETGTIADGAQLRMYFLNVGQGDSEFIELPNGQTMLIDAGNPANGSEIVGFIKNKQHSKIDYVVATHPHSDHIGGMPEVLQSFSIGKMYMPKKEHTTNAFETLLNTIESEKIALYTAKSGVSVLLDGQLKINILAPIQENNSDLNQCSAVVKITYGQASYLFMGDAGSVVESDLLRSGAELKATVLKVGHHGSATASSAAFLSKVSPQAAVISCGLGNSYGHPTSQTLSALFACGASVYRTDEVGTICITGDSNGKITVDKAASAKKENAPPAVTQSSQTEQPSTNTTAVAPGNSPAQNGGTGETVYITKTGECYHRDGCSSLRKSKIPSTVSQAKQEGYRPCSRCNPPQ